MGVKPNITRMSQQDADQVLLLSSLTIIQIGPYRKFIYTDLLLEIESKHLTRHDLNEPYHELTKYY